MNVFARCETHSQGGDCLSKVFVMKLKYSGNPSGNNSLCVIRPFLVCHGAFACIACLSSGRDSAGTRHHQPQQPLFASNYAATNHKNNRPITPRIHLLCSNEKCQRFCQICRISAKANEGTSRVSAGRQAIVGNE